MGAGLPNSNRNERLAAAIPVGGETPLGFRSVPCKRRSICRESRGEKLLQRSESSAVGRHVPNPAPCLDERQKAKSENHSLLARKPGDRLRPAGGTGIGGFLHALLPAAADD